MEKVLSKIETLVAANVTNDPADYVMNGVLMCGKCHTPKQHKGVILGKERTLPCLCRCEYDRKEKERREREAENQKFAINRYRSEGFPESEMKNWTFESAENSKIIAAAKKYADNFQQLKEAGKGLLLYGGVGTGKTYAAACIVNDLIDEGRRCMITNFARVLNTLWSVEKKQAYIDSFNQFELLVLDDLGAERRSEYAQEQVFNVIDARYRAKLPLIITTNLALEDLTAPQNIGNSRIYDRVLEMCHPVKVEGESRRTKKALNSFADMNKMLGL